MAELVARLSFSPPAAFDEKRPSRGRVCFIHEGPKPACYASKGRTIPVKKISPGFLSLAVRVESIPPTTDFSNIVQRDAAVPQQAKGRGGESTKDLSCTPVSPPPFPGGKTQRRRIGRRKVCVWAGRKYGLRKQEESRTSRQHVRRDNRVRGQQHRRHHLLLVRGTMLYITKSTKLSCVVRRH